MSARVGVVVMTAILALYLVLIGQRAWLLLTSGDAVAITMGVALVVIPIIGAWAVGRELLFGVQAEKLARRLEAEDALPTEQIDVRTSGRPLRDQADQLFPAYRADVEQHPEDWRAWFRLSLAYDGAGDRKRAREAARRAIKLARG
ncbi:hypothetical protein [Microbacterium sp. bgisy189]|uniref:hypothetical protein n=1 Tax=Microbacterium sp. bgisy189 TaxID=3413798 RepID=UPI003EBC849F